MNQTGVRSTDCRAQASGTDRSPGPRWPPSRTRRQGYRGTYTGARTATAPTSTRARIGLIALVAAYAFLDLAAAAPNSPLLPPLPKGVGVPSWMARGPGDIGLDGIGRLGLTLAAIGPLAAAVAAFVVVL